MEQLNENLSEAFISFIENHPPKSLKRNLLFVFMKFSFSLEGGSPFNLYDILFDFKELFELIDLIEDETEIKEQ
jgi:hypothetical protein